MESGDLWKNTGMEHTVNEVTIELVHGDITRQPDIDAIVNAANAQLLIGGGVAGAIHRAAGPELERECRPLAPIRPGGAVITGAHRLPNRRVIHVLGPVYGRDKPEADLLAQCYRNALLLADRESLHSVATPAVSTGAFGYPMRNAAYVAFTTIRETTPQLRSVALVRFVLFSRSDLDIHREILDSIQS